jgi:transcription elongation factor GreA
MDKNYVTPEAYKLLKQELEELKTKKRKEIAETIQDAKELGDLAENAAYQEAKDAQSVLETRILQLEMFLKNISIIRHASNNHVVELGSTIEVNSLTKTKNKKVFTIVGSHEAKPTEGKISNESPLGRAFLGGKKGEIVLVNTPQGEVKYKILKIS